MGSCGNSYRKPVGIGWEWELKFHSHCKPGITQEISLSDTSIDNLDINSDV